MKHIVLIYKSMLVVTSALHLHHVETVHAAGQWNHLPSSDQLPWHWNSIDLESNQDLHPTGEMRAYNFTISRATFAPDGIDKAGILVNNQFPGPLIEANWGDTIQVTVYNNITGPEESTSIHWHGLHQIDTPWYDGVPGVSQCPIAPGSSVTYTFLANVYGTSFWHAHMSAQYTAGVHGPMIIYGPSHVEYDIDLGPIVVGDWYHAPYTESVKGASAATQNTSVYIPISDNSLINGRNGFNCSLVPSNASCNPTTGFSHFRFQHGKTHRLRLINAGAAALVHFSIDEHELEIVAMDMVPVQPYKRDFVTLGAGQRTDVLVEAKHKPTHAFWLRSTISLNCSVTTQPFGRAIVLYDKAAENAIPISSIGKGAARADEKLFLCKNDALHKTVPAIPVLTPEHVDLTITILVNLTTNETGSNVWLLNNITQRTNYDEPVLLSMNAGNLSFAPQQNVYNLARNKTVRIVLNNAYQSAHPMHLHGHNFAVISEGSGFWNGETTNLTNPPRRDVHLLRRYGHLVIQFTTDNPGAWLYHCHIAWHASTGFNMVLLESPDELVAMKMPEVTQDTCVAWKKWEKTHAVEQIDSGI